MSIRGLGDFAAISLSCSLACLISCRRNSAALKSSGPPGQIPDSRHLDTKSQPLAKPKPRASAWPITKRRLICVYEAPIDGARLLYFSTWPPPCWARDITSHLYPSSLTRRQAAAAALRLGFKWGFPFMKSNHEGLSC